LYLSAYVTIQPLGVALQPALLMYVLWQGGDQIISKREDEHRIYDA